MCMLCYCSVVPLLLLCSCSVVGLVLLCSCSVVGLVLLCGCSVVGLVLLCGWSVIARLWTWCFSKFFFSNEFMTLFGCLDYVLDAFITLYYLLSITENDVKVRFFFVKPFFKRSV